LADEADRSVSGATARDLTGDVASVGKLGWNAEMVYSPAGAEVDWIHFEDDSIRADDLEIALVVCLVNRIG
jgi:hypothetical protein